MKFISLLFSLMIFMSWVGMAHELRPGYLEIHQTNSTNYKVQWKVPAKDTQRFRLNPLFPDSCSQTTPATTVSDGASFLDRWTLKCEEGLEGKEIQIDGLDRTLTDALVRIEHMTGDSQVERLTADKNSFIVKAVPALSDVIRTYLYLGIEHILLGVDHLLFVLGLLILVKTTRKLIATITAFTLAHSITLALSSLQLVSLPQAPVEAVIALSILFLATEIHLQSKGVITVSQRFPWVVAFTFGLLHGFGFAGALTEIGFPAQAIPTALLFFNIGVELGQLIFIFAVEFLIKALKRFVNFLPPWAFQVPAYTIGSLSAFWLIERISGFWP